MVEDHAHAASTGTASAPPRTQYWRIARASLSYLLDTFALSRGIGWSIVDPLIVSVVLEANVAPINQDVALSSRYAALDSPPPDELRRPVSINAAAASLRMPYETVRRRIMRLAEAGICKVTPRGVIVPAATVNNPAYWTAATGRYERLRAFYFEVKALGALSGVVSPSNPPKLDGPPIRGANRVIGEYTLRVVDDLHRRVGDLIAGLAMFEMAWANLEHLTPEARDTDGPVPDELRKPVSTTELSRRMGLPAETVRRHVALLSEKGLCRRERGGWLAIPGQLSQGPEHSQGLADNLANLQRLVVRLAALGVVAYWEAEAAASQSTVTSPTGPG